MKLGLSKTVIIVVILLLTAISSFFLGKSTIENKYKIVVDTVLIKEPVEVKKEVKDIVYVKIPETVKDTIINESIRYITDKDTVFLEMQETRVLYKDSLYEAEVSGINPKLDYIKIYDKNVEKVSKDNKVIGFIESEYLFLENCNVKLGLSYKSSDNFYVKCGYQIGEIRGPYIGIECKFNLF